MGFRKKVNKFILVRFGALSDPTLTLRVLALVWVLVPLALGLPFFIVVNAVLGYGNWVLILSFSLGILFLFGLFSYKTRNFMPLGHVVAALLCFFEVMVYQSPACHGIYLILVLMPMVAVGILGVAWGGFWTAVNLALLVGAVYLLPTGFAHMESLTVFSLDSLMFWVFIILGVAGAYGIATVLQLTLGSMVKRNRSIHDQLINRQRVLVGLMEEETLFYQILSHDLRAPVMKVTQFLGMYLNERDTFDEETWPKVLNDIYRSSEGLSVLLENLFNWIKNRRGHGAVNREHYSFQQILLDLKGIYSPMARSKDIELSISIDDASFVTDGYIVTTILRNLLSNALKFTPRKGQIVVDAGLTPGGRPFFRVTDSGRGFDMTQWEALKTTAMTNEVPHSRGTENEVGSGFGLRMCLILARTLGAELKVQPLETRGTAFTLVLPDPAV